MSFNNVAVITIEGNNYRIQFQFMTKRDAVNRMKKVDLSEKRRSVSKRKQRKTTKNDL